MTIEELVFKYGEEYRKLIEDAITWLEAHEDDWKLDGPIDRDGFILTLIQQKRRT